MIRRDSMTGLEVVENPEPYIGWLYINVPCPTPTLALRSVTVDVVLELRSICIGVHVKLYVVPVGASKS